MRRTISALLAALALAAVTAVPALGHISTDPCGASAADYAAHHVAALARAGELGGGEHTPGLHQGYAGLCLGLFD